MLCHIMLEYSTFCSHSFIGKKCSVDQGSVEWMDRMYVWSYPAVVVYFLVVQ